MDAGRPDLADGFTKKTFTAMIEDVREAATRAGLIEAEICDADVQALYRTAETDCYIFFKGTGATWRERNMPPADRANGRARERHHVLHRRNGPDGRLLSLGRFAAPAAERGQALTTTARIAA